MSSQKDSIANERLTQKLRERFGDDKLRVMSIRWYDDKKLGPVVIRLQRTINESAFEDIGFVTVDTELRDIPPEKSCYDEDVLCAVAENFPPEKLRTKS